MADHLVVRVQRAGESVAVDCVLDGISIMSGDVEVERLELGPFGDLLVHGLVRTQRGTYVELPSRSSELSS